MIEDPANTEIYVSIPDRRIDVWLADLDAPPDRYDLLSADERERAARFRAVIDQRRFIASRGILRTLLGGYLATAPQSVPLMYGPHGKPGVQADRLHFNLSHSRGRALFAFSSRSPIGVDLEFVRVVPDLLHVAASIFSPAEANAFAAIPPEARLPSFFKCWTRKEALIKARGTGLSYPLDRLSVSFDEPARVMPADGDRTESTGWHLYHLEPEPDCFAAIATQQENAQIAMHDLS